MVVRMVQGATNHDADPMDGGWSVQAWVRLWQESVVFRDGSPEMLAWPDGEPLLKQPAIVVNMIGAVESAAVAAMKQLRSLPAYGRTSRH